MTIFYIALILTALYLAMDLGANGPVRRYFGRVWRGE